MKRTKKRTIMILLIVLFLAFMVAAFRQELTVRVYHETSEKLEAPVRIVLLSDLHSTIYGEQQQELIECIRMQSPDIVCLAGDIADDYVAHDGTKLLLSVIAQEYPCYYVAGNHEFWSGQANEIKDMIRSYGVTVLEGAAVEVTVKGQTLTLYGVDDPDGFARATRLEDWRAQLRDFTAAGNTRYSILLSHRPEQTEVYRRSGMDLVLAGHAHGGQIRLPGLINGLFSPDQGFFPAYAGGQYQLDETNMIVSRGLCRNNLPRIFNPPELVVVNLLPAQPVE